MWLKQIKMINFRNFRRFEADHFKRWNIILGENAAGKTNFLEALHLLCGGRAFHSVSKQPLIRWEQDYFYLSAIGEENNPCFFEINFSDSGTGEFKIDGRKTASKQFRNFLKSVTFLPGDILLLKGNPEQRRMYLNRLLGFSDPDYQEIYSRYEKTLKQRNAQLKINPSKAVIWNQSLVEYGSEIILRRIRLVKELQKQLRRYFKQMYGSEVKIHYLNTFRFDQEIKKSYLEALNNRQREEAAKGYTVIGPHRDNFSVAVEDRKIEEGAALSYQRALSLGMQLFAAILFYQIKQIKPILLLDDVLFELDDEHRRLFYRLIPEYFQVFQTLHSESWISDPPEKPNIIRIRKEEGVNSAG